MKNREENIGVIYEKKDYAGFLKRVVIAMIDIVVIAAVSACGSYFVDSFFSFEETHHKFNFIFIVAFSITYLAILKRSKFRTVGYLLARVKIVDLKGERPSVFKMILRELLILLGPFELFTDIVWLTSEATKQTLRDKYVGTYVIRQNAIPVGKGRLQNVSLGFMGWNLVYREVQESQIK
ncbi:MAG: RDD family protein [Desulfobacteraceae bacterium]